MRIRAGAAKAARKRVRAQGCSKMQRRFYRLRKSVRGGGEARSKTKELAEYKWPDVGGPMKSGAEIATVTGNTKTTAPVTTGSFGWQHTTLQSTAVVRPLWSQPAIGISCAELASLELFLGACPCNGHITPSQQAIPAACKAAAQAGAQSSITAARHTHAPNLLPGASES